LKQKDTDSSIAIEPTLSLQARAFKRKVSLGNEKKIMLIK
jgi:hypothetical protein